MWEECDRCKEDVNVLIKVWAYGHASDRWSDQNWCLTCIHGGGVG